MEGPRERDQIDLRFTRLIDIASFWSTYRALETFGRQWLGMQPDFGAASATVFVGGETCTTVT